MVLAGVRAKDFATQAGFLKPLILPNHDGKSSLVSIPGSVRTISTVTALVPGMTSAPERLLNQAEQPGSFNDSVNHSRYYFLRIVSPAIWQTDWPDVSLNLVWPESGSLCACTLTVSMGMPRQAST